MATLFSDTFEVERIDYDSAKKIKEKKFDQVSRIEAKSEYFDYYLTIDVNTAIYPIKEDEKFEMMLSDSLYEQKPAAEMKYDASKKLDSRAESFEYIMQGIVFKYSQEKSKAVVYASYGGLLMQLRGEATMLTSQRFAVDSKLYLFMRRTT